jgi:hypothetical protein
VVLWEAMGVSSVGYNCFVGFDRFDVVLTGRSSSRRTASQLRHTKGHWNTCTCPCTKRTSNPRRDKTQIRNTHSIALQIRHLVSLMQVLGDGRLAAACRASNDPDVLVL